MSPENIKAIKDALEPLAQKLGQGASFLYETAYKQTVIEAIQDLTLGGLGLIAILLILFFGIKAIKKGLDDGEVDLAFFLICMGGSAVIALSLWAGAGIMGGAKKLANPHYYTIQSIINQVRN